MEIKLNFCGGLSIDTVHERLQQKAKEVNTVLNTGGVFSDEIILTYDFNDSFIKSTDTIDDAYLRIIGKTKTEFDAKRKEDAEQWKKEEEEWKNKIPSITKEYCDKARGVIREDKYEYWDTIVPIRLGDLYHGMELNATIEILNEWNTSHDKDKCKTIIDNQGHSGMSYSLVCAMIKEFAKGSPQEIEEIIVYFRG